MSPNVYRLPVHLEGANEIVFDPHADLSTLPTRVDRGSRTELTGWLELNQHDPYGHQFTYTEFPVHFVWNSDSKSWSRRQRYQQHQTVSRMYFVSPGQGERYYLRLLLNHVEGAQSFADIRTVDDVVHNTFQEACCARGLLDDDSEWQRCMDEAKRHSMPRQLRQLFTTILDFNNPQRPGDLWEEFKDYLCEDYRHRARTSCTPNTMPDNAAIENMAVWDIECALRTQGRSMADFPGMPIPVEPANHQMSRLMQQEYDYDQAKLRQEVAQEVATLVPRQHSFYRAMMETIYGPSGLEPRTHFLQSAGGCGKTYLLNLVLKTIRSKGDIAIAVATSGIAALLLQGGTTAHSRFGIPLDLGGTSSLKMRSERVEIIRLARVIIWDEAPMANKDNFRVVDLLLRDVMKTVDPDLEHVPFGGKVVICSGDWRQILPVVPRGNRGSILDACLKSSPLWSHFVVWRLEENMRVRCGSQSADDSLKAAYAQWLLKVGDGCLPNPLEIPQRMLIPSTRMADIVADVFESFDGDHLEQTCILTPKNKVVDELNDYVLDLVPGQQHTYLSADYFGQDSEDDASLYPTELLNTLQPAGMPRHDLHVKPGAPVILIRNLDRTKGLMNGTRLVIVACFRHYLEARVVNGSRVGTIVLLPRINLTPPDNKSTSIRFVRRQFPIRLAFCMTINKAQGQTFKRVGLFLPDHVFAHGQCYVALSRCGDPNGLRIMLQSKAEGDPACSGKMINVVWEEVLH